LKSFFSLSFAKNFFQYFFPISQHTKNVIPAAIPFSSFRAVHRLLRGRQGNKKTAVPTNGNGGFNYLSTQPQDLPDLLSQKPFST
jgi:hypothetical protein